MAKHEVTVITTVPMDATAPVFWQCSCGAVSDEDFDTSGDAIAHYNAVHGEN